MIILEDGFQIEGTIDNSIVKINNEWTKIIIIKTNLSIEEAENLFKDNRIFIYGDTVYMADGYIKTMQENSITYTWLRFDYNYLDDSKRKIEELEEKQQVQDMVIEEILFDIIPSLGGIGGE